LTLVDSSVWIAYLRGQRSIATDKMTALTLADVILLCDIILLEVLQGARDDRHAARLNQILRRYSSCRYSVSIWPSAPPKISGACGLLGSQSEK
jgi:predicted nucleic acid-binding protein